MAVTPILMLLLVYGSAASEMQPLYETSAPLEFGPVPAGTYDTQAYYEPGAIGLLFGVVQTFLYVVQPHSFPEDLIRKIAQQKFGQVHNDYQKVIYYELGFIIAAVLGLLFVLLMPLVGLCFCMCRCCGNCGGEMHQRQKKNADCQRGCFATFLFASSVVMSVGVLCAYAANEHLTNQVRGAKKLVNSNFKDLKTLINDMPMQIDYLVNQYNTTKNRAISDLNNIGPLLGKRIHEQLTKKVHPALDAVLIMAGAIRETKEALENVSASVEILQEGTERLQANLKDAKTNLSNTLNDPACAQDKTVTTCNNIKSSLIHLNINANFSGLPDVSPQLANVNDVLKTDLTNLVQKGYAALNDTPELVQNQTKNIKSDIKNVFESIGSNITNFSKVIPLHHLLSNLTVHISKSETYIRNYFPVVEQYDFYRWLGFLVLCCTVMLILVFYYLGLMCGACGYDKKSSPTTRGCISNTAGNFLMAGVGISFIFSWVLMTLVVVTFIAGGNIEKLVCEPFEDRALFKVLDMPYLINSQWRNYLSGILLQNPDINLTFEKVYSDCKENKGIYSALRIDNLFNINDLLNVSMYTEDISEKFEKVNVNLSNIILLDDKGKQNLQNFSSTKIDEIDFAAFLAEIGKNITKVDLLAYANSLETSALQLPKGALENALKGHANSIRMIHIQLVLPLEQSMSILNQSIRLLQRTAPEFPGEIANVITSVDAAQMLIRDNASSVVIQETKKYMETIIGYFVLYIQWFKDSIAMDVAACKPIANFIDTAVDVFLCSYLVDSMNTFWFGLGAATIFLIPAIICAIKLAKFYRRMDTEDVYDDIETVPMKNLENGNNGYHNEHVYGIQNPVMTSGVEQW
ncbi:prominin-1 isoform X2 [Rhinatrema bivittatum]|uniref:prominin-1 isoform X2 n=1 Tax=Rhinatrema bivittatum TaxID=194408 RepID=UPI001126DA7F|nr:prominin-1 isoform X2 [Rhinatrema bivittatum]